jgi:hypothetical protein
MTALEAHRVQFVNTVAEREEAIRLAEAREVARIRVVFAAAR